MIEIIKTQGNLSLEMKNKIKLSLDKFIITILIKKVKYSPEQIRKLETDFKSIIGDEFINIFNAYL